MNELSSQAGKTILFVSHDMGAIQNLCNIGMLFDKGQCVFSGEAHESVRQYLELGSENKNTVMRWDKSDNENYSFSETVKIKGYGVVDEDRKLANTQLLGSKKYRVIIEAELLKPEPNLDFFVSLFLEDGSLLYVTDLYDSGNISPGDIQPGKITLSFELPTYFLSNQRYFLEMSCLIHYRGWPLPFNASEQTRLYFDFYQDKQSNLLYETSHPMVNSGVRPGLLAPVIPWQNDPH
jgi:lipopolysaccharide transport system ATP-binding protein